MVHRRGEGPRAGDRGRGLKHDRAEAIDFSRHAEKAGADAVLVVTPYYNKPAQEGLFQHFKAVNDAIGIPIIIYNIPPRSVVDMSVDTMARLFELKNIVGVKDATGNLARVSQQRHAMGPDFIQLSGDDMTALASNAAGGHGCISVVVERRARALRARFSEAASPATFASALEVQDRLVPLHKAIFLEAGLGRREMRPFAASGAGNEEMRLPMLPVTEPTRAVIRQAMVHAGLAQRLSAMC